MKSIGGFLFWFGAGSMVLYMIDMEFILLTWIESWGPEIAWTIRGAMAVVGGIMWLIGMKQEAGGDYEEVGD